MNTSTEQTETDLDPTADRTVEEAESLVLDPGTEQTVRVEGIKKHFPVYEGVLQRKSGEVRAVDGVSFTIPKGTTFGLVGESGSGKTTTGKAMLRIVEPTAGRIEVAGQDVMELSGRELKQFRQKMQMVFQDPTSSLNPRKRVKDIIAEPMKVHNINNADERLERIEELLEIIDLPREFMYKYPTALSGGQKQRIGIARAVALNPEFVVLDEPTSALDVSVQARIVNLFNKLQNEFDLTYLFISHDLSLVKSVSDWIGVMYLGRLVEVGDAQSVFQNPQHPYTRALLSAIPTVTEKDKQHKPERIRLEGEIPDPREKPSGCAFRSRCPEEFEDCSKKEPPLYEVDDRHYARCFLHDENIKPEGVEW
jgi:oligopeptide transport system ATP-binding protein